MLSHGAWHPLEELEGLGGLALLEKVCLWVALRFQALTPSPVYLFFSWSADQFVVLSYYISAMYHLLSAMVVMD